ncbi:hypothetical protein, partial [Williamwhitmania taraxaci]
MKDRLSRFVFTCLALLGITVITVNAQEQNLYCIAVKQHYSAWGDCGSPSFNSVDVKINNSDSTLKVLTIYTNKKDSVLPFGEDYYNASEYKNVSGLVDLRKNPLTGIHVYGHVNGMENDNNLDYEFELSDLKVGESTLSRDASDPCSNSWNWSGKRQGYNMTTTIYIDDPIHLRNGNTSTNSKYCLDTEVLPLHVGPYYDNKSKEKPVLEVALDNGGEYLDTVRVTVSPDAIINLTYEKIAGRKDDPSSNYYKWMGRSLKFRVVKTLLNGKKTVGKPVLGVVFYPKGLQYTIMGIKRTYCNSDVIVKVKLDNYADTGYINIDEKYFYWVAAVFVNGVMDPSLIYKCQMESLGDLTYRIVISDNNGKDPFNEPNPVPVEWKLQLQETNNTGSFACVRSFTIPAKPPKITASQIGKEMFPLGDPVVKYDVPDMNHPYVLLKIEDDFAFSYLRKPYKIVCGTDTLATINDLPDSYDAMTTTQKDSVDLIFE